MSHSFGKVYLVGAGPGDPGLLTVRGRELLERAQVVVYDSLVNAELLRHAAHAETIFVGKAPTRHALPQEDINRVLREQAERVDCVVRLKGGDPFVFGRGAEEAAFLAAEGIPFEIVPGITAGVGAPEYAGIPVTHRGLSASVTFVTGHTDPSADPKTLSFDRFHLDGTLVFYMGMTHLTANLKSLIRLGRPADTPAAAIQWGTLARQRTVVGTLETLPGQCRDAGLDAPPVLIVVGEVVALRESLNWFESRPLYGKRIAVTRTRSRSGELIGRLRDLGADVFEFPTIEIAPEPIEDLNDITEYDWVILTSVNGVDTLFDRMQSAGLDARDLHGVKLCAISARTADALRARFLIVDAIPDRYETDRVVAVLEETGGALDGKRFLLPRADIGRSSLPDALRAKGGEVTELRAYRTIVPKDAETLAETLVAYRPDYITFGSAAAARNFHRVVGEERIRTLNQSAVYATIGPIASQAAQELGMPVAIEPKIHRVANLVDAIAEWNAAHLSE